MIGPRLPFLVNRCRTCGDVLLAWEVRDNGQHEKASYEDQYTINVKLCGPVEEIVVREEDRPFDITTPK